MYIKAIAYIIYCQLEGRDAVATMAVAASKCYAAAGRQETTAGVHCVSDNSTKSARFTWPPCPRTLTAKRKHEWKYKLAHCVTLRLREVIEMKLAGRSPAISLGVSC